MLAFEGGEPVRRNPLPYARQTIDDDDVRAVVEVLNSPWLTTGPMVQRFEAAVVEYVGARDGVAVANGTAALHCALDAARVGAGDEVIVPPVTFVATANAVVFQGATPVFADVRPGNLTLDADAVEARITPRTKAVIAVDYGGHPCDYDGLRRVARRHGLTLIADACHALGAQYHGRLVGRLADLTVFSFHPVKHVTTAEGGMIVTDDTSLGDRMRVFRNHGLTTDHRERRARGTTSYEMMRLGYNYRLSDVQCALGCSQMKKLPVRLERREAIARQYAAAFADDPCCAPLDGDPDIRHAYHLYVVRFRPDRLTVGRDGIVAALWNEGVMAAVHYPPVHLQPYYRERFGYQAGACPVAEDSAAWIVSLPMFPAMTDDDVKDVISAVAKVTARYSRDVA